MQILNGKKTAKEILDTLEIDVAQRAATGKKVPHLAAILVGNDGASETYVASKVKACNQIGFISTLIHFDDKVAEQRLLEKIEELNEDMSVDGILVQLPLPAHISEKKVILPQITLQSKTILVIETFHCSIQISSGSA